jgi:hypothetical protein
MNFLSISSIRRRHFGEAQRLCRFASAAFAFGDVEWFRGARSRSSGQILMIALSNFDIPTIHLFILEEFAEKLADFDLCIAEGALSGCSRAIGTARRASLAA